MNNLLAKHKPVDVESQEQWEKDWERSSWVLQPFANALKDMLKGLETIKPDDFDCHNHYARLVAQQMKKQTIDQILAMFPSTVDK
jgi:hypothetical protein